MTDRERRLLMDAARTLADAKWPEGMEQRAKLIGAELSRLIADEVCEPWSAEPVAAAPPY